MSGDFSSAIDIYSETFTENKVRQLNDWINAYIISENQLDGLYSDSLISLYNDNDQKLPSDL